MKKLILSLAIPFIIPIICLALPMNCDCYSSYLAPSGWVTMHFHYAVNNGNCTPTGSNTYNFGSAEVYYDGQYLGTTYYGPGFGNNINDYLSCDNTA